MPNPHPPDLSVVIPTRDRKALLLQELRAFAAQTVPPEQFEVIAVVDGSTDGTLEALDDLDLPYVLQHVWRPGTGRAAACNAGIRSARGEFVLLLDDDMLPSPGLVEAHLAAHRAEGQLGVVGPVPIRIDGSSSPVVRYIGTKFNEHLRALAKGKPIGLRDLYTGNFSARRETLIEVGLFDEAFTMYGNEDLELGVRLRAAGVRLVYAPKAVAEQRYTKPFPALARDNEAKGRTAVQLARKHPQALPALKLSERGSTRRRLARTSMLGLTRLWSGTPAALMKAFGALERLAPRVAERAYPSILDYFYWRGANAELGRPDAAGIKPR